MKLDSIDQPPATAGGSDFCHYGRNRVNYRRFGRTNWEVSEIGYGMWGMGGWTGSDDEEPLASLQPAVYLGWNFFDTAWVSGTGQGDIVLGQIDRSTTEKRH